MKTAKKSLFSKIADFLFTYKPVNFNYPIPDNFITIPPIKTPKKFKNVGNTRRQKTQVNVY